MKLKSFYLSEIRNLKEDLKLDFKHLFLERLNITELELNKDDLILNSEQLKILNNDIEELKNDKPLAYILNSQFFLGFQFYVDHRVLIPRPETEYLVDYVLSKVLTRMPYQNSLLVLDAGAGSGCIGISLLLKNQNIKCIFIENSKLAIEVIQINLKKYEISEDRYFIFETFEELESHPQFKSKSEKNVDGSINLDLFISNPPYISVEDGDVQASVFNYEPHTALFCEDQGLFYLKKWSKMALKYLNKDHGMALFEFGQNQENILQTFAFKNKMKSEIILDQYERPRFWKIVP